MSGPMHSSFRHLLNFTITFTLASGEELIYPIPASCKSIVSLFRRSGCPSGLREHNNVWDQAKRRFRLYFRTVVNRECVWFFDAEQPQFIFGRKAPMTVRCHDKGTIQAFNDQFHCLLTERECCNRDKIILPEPFFERKKISEWLFLLRWLFGWISFIITDT